MSCLKDFSWWPTQWTNAKVASLTTEEIKQQGVLKNARLSAEGLTLVSELNSVVYTAEITARLSEDFMILLRHILLQHWGEPITNVENVEIGFDYLL
jgi:hypothetical protein